MLRRGWLALGSMLLATAAPVARAQQVDLLPSAASRCLQPPADQRGVPDYPFVAWKTGEKGRVKVELEFTTPDRRPRVQVLERDGPDSMVDAVQAHVRQWRVPCLTEAEGTARLQMEFIFTGDDRRVQWSRVVDAAGPEQRALLKCVSHASGRQGPGYPREALRAELQGRVLARLRFVAADQPPQAEIFARPAARLLAGEVEEWVAGYRMPCHAGAPVQSLWNFMFRIETSAYGFKPLDLLQLMAVVRDIGKQTVALDTTSMACPFDLKFAYQQPFLPNRVGEVGAADPSRRPLLEWLEGVELNLPQRTQDAVFGDTTTVSVPCVKIDLKPKENK